jgi:uncharacterized membrane protein
MPPHPSLREGLIQTIRPPTDLIAALVWTALALIAVYLPIVNQSPLMILFGLPLVLFIPGYVLIAALFPRSDDLDWIERIALSFGLSIAVVPLIGLGLNYTPWGIRLDPILVSLSLFTLAMAVAATIRRLSLPAEEQLTIPPAAVVTGIRAELFEAGQSKVDRALSIILLISILAAIGTTAYVIAVPKEGEHFTEFYILGAEGKAADYPTSFALNTPQWVTVGVGNHEYRNVTYTVEAQAVNQSFDPATNTSTIDRMQVLNRYQVTLAQNTTDEQKLTFTVQKPGYNEIQFLLFNETVPDESVTGQERIDRSDRDLHLWIKTR